MKYIILDIPISAMIAFCWTALAFAIGLRGGWLEAVAAVTFFGAMLSLMLTQAAHS